MITARSLLAEAARLYDAPDAPFAHAARRAWRSGFASAADWMELALDVVRNDRQTDRETDRTTHRRPTRARLNVAGLAKNGGAALAAAAIGGAIGVTTGAALGGGAVSLALASGAGLAGFVLAFYAVEGQMVFLFPILLDGHHDGESLASLFAECRAWTVRAGGTLAVMRVVMPISARMMFGGFVGQGFLRSWCLGCLSVVLWYEELRSGALEHTCEVVEATA